MGLRIIFLFILVIVAIFVTAFLAQFALTGTDPFRTLGFSLGDGCSGSLFLSVSGAGRCSIKAEVLTSKCNGRTYEIREDSCFGDVKCERVINYDSDQSTCTWNALSGSYNYVLCVNRREKDYELGICR